MAETNLGRVAIVPKGTYSASVQYMYLDLVYYNGSSYLVHTQPTIGTLPTDTNYFYLAAQGAEVEMRYDSVTDYIQWKLITDATWNNLIQPADFTPTIVQITGTSETDVMSQKAVSNITNSRVISHIEHVNFTNASGSWRFQADAGWIYMNNGVKIKSNLVADIAIPNDGYYNIIGNLDTGEITVSALANITDHDTYVLIGTCYPIVGIFSMKIQYTVNGETFPLVTNKFINQGVSSATTKPEWVTFIEKADGWHLIIDAGTVFLETLNHSHVNLAADILLNVDYNYILANSETGEISISNKSDANLLLRGSNKYTLLGVAFPNYGIYSMNVSYNVNGRPYNLTSPQGFDLTIDTPAPSNTLSFVDSEATPIYKDAVFKSLNGGRKTNLILETTLASGEFRRYEIHNPTRLTAADLGANAKYVIETELTTKLYKDVTHVYKSVSTGKPLSIKIMTIGDSLAQGNASTNYAPLAIIKDKYAAQGITVVPCGTFNQDDGRGVRSDIISEGRGYWNYKTFVGKDSSPYGQPIIISTGTGLTTKFENPFLRLANATDKTTHPEWCFTNKVANPADDDGVAYATDPSQPSGNYYIFDFSYYLTQHSVTVPDIITIALGINDWQETGVMNINDEYLSMQIMYQQIRAALPNAEIMLIPTNGIFPVNQTQWEQEMFPLLERILKYCEDSQASDTKLHVCPIYQHIGRFNAYNTESSTANINTWNTVKQTTMSDVHVLDKASSRDEYMRAFEATLLSLF